jgi:hypothetical protein
MILKGAVPTKDENLLKQIADNFLSQNSPSNPVDESESNSIDLIEPSEAPFLMKMIMGSCHDLTERIGSSGADLIGLLFLFIYLFILH